jgi:hypothetical protein
LAQKLLWKSDFLKSNYPNAIFSRSSEASPASFSPFWLSLVAGKNLEDAVFNATMGCIITALLFRVFRLALEYCAKQVIAEKARLRELEKANPADTPAAGKFA